MKENYIRIQALVHDKDFNSDNCQFDLTSHFNGKPKKHYEFLHILIKKIQIGIFGDLVRKRES